MKFAFPPCILLNREFSIKKLWWWLRLTLILFSALTTAFLLLNYILLKLLVEVISPSDFDYSHIVPQSTSWSWRVLICISCLFLGISTVQSSHIGLRSSVFLAHLLFLRPSDSIKVRMTDSFFGCNSFSVIHFQKPFHEVQGCLAKLTHVSSLQSLWLRYVLRKFVAYESWILLKKLLLFLGQST